MSESLLSLLDVRITSALLAAFGPDVSMPTPLVLPAKDVRHGDYTCSAPMALARTLGEAPLVLAEKLVQALDVADICEAPEVVKPGFVNLRIRSDWLATRVEDMLGHPTVGIEPVPNPKTVVFDYSSPNVAKEMHVGHLRSTIIGDCLANVSELVGNRVERLNHLGDWGTQFGMLITHLADVHPEAIESGSLTYARWTESLSLLGNLVMFYQAAKVRFDEDEEFAERARRRVVDLQAGEPTARAAWTVLVELSRHENQEIYDLLGVQELTDRGESFYEPMLGDVVADLETKGLVAVDGGAKCVFAEGFTNKEGDPLPLIVQKADGGYNYATTDLAAIRHRVDNGADRIVYVVDAGQSLHLQMVFAVARMAGWLPDHLEATHVGFGLVLGEDGKRLRTRSGETVRLRALLDEALQRSGTFVSTRATERGQEPPDDIDLVARVIGIGAVKYADLSQNRQSNYVFSFDKMLSLKGNTAPYLQYAYARMRSILREAGWADGPPAGNIAVELGDSQERALAKHLVEFADVVQRTASELSPNHLCAYLYELSQVYNQFYEHCPVLRSEQPLRTSRLALCESTAATLKLGLGLLGIEVLERL
ncbi:MAG: arginine--tRNA ligase [Acidimicrobiales bacterium]